MKRSSVSLCVCDQHTVVTATTPESVCFIYSYYVSTIVLAATKCGNAKVNQVSELGWVKYWSFPIGCWSLIMNWHKH